MSKPHQMRHANLSNKLGALKLSPLDRSVWSRCKKAFLGAKATVATMSGPRDSRSRKPLLFWKLPLVGTKVKISLVTQVWRDIRKKMCPRIFANCFRNIWNLQRHYWLGLGCLVMFFSMVGLTQRCGMLQVSRANNGNGIQQAIQN